jgi:Zn-dependent protease with chaperone function
MRSGLPGRAFILLLGWNLLGAYVGMLAFKLAERPPAEALLGHACSMTLWAFVGLLVLPALSRKAVFAADRAAADSGIDPRAWITRFPQLVNEDGSSSPTVQAIFYPIPSAVSRLRQLEQPFSGFVPGNLARSNLYYSWATFTLLGRAVHCNVGRPALWVFPPG